MAKFSIVKFTGADGMHGTPSESLGLSADDSVIPAWYTPDGLSLSQGAGAAIAQPVIRPVGNGSRYSMESVFKLILSEPPKSQVTNVRVYPVYDLGNSAFKPVARIGQTNAYFMPTNARSLIAVHDLSQYDAANPFVLSVNGMRGERHEKDAGTLEYAVTLNDAGFGNEVYLNGRRQPTLRLATGVKYTFKAPANIPFVLDDGEGNLIAPAKAGNMNVYELLAKNAEQFPDGILYYSNEPRDGSFIEFTELTIEERPKRRIEVMADIDNRNGVSYFDGYGRRLSTLRLVLGTDCEIANISGKEHPMRFFNEEGLPSTAGISIANGGTSDELITIDAEAQLKSAIRAVRFMSAADESVGGSVILRAAPFCGGYNIRNVGGGVSNPSQAGETDYIYMQLEVNAETNPGSACLSLAVEWDEA